jgi:uncharacterized protein (TIGR02300 family)
MSTKAARGAKRACQSCGNKFYDLNRAPITCPICGAVFHAQETTTTRAKAAAIVGNAVEDDDDDVVAASTNGVEVVSLTDVEADENELPDLEDNELVDIEDEEADLGEEEAFIEVEEDDDGGDVTGLVGGGREDDEEV